VCKYYDVCCHYFVVADWKKEAKDFLWRREKERPDGDPAALPGLLEVCDIF
jgi:hypothetical protein